MSTDTAHLDPVALRKLFEEIEAMKSQLAAVSGEFETLRGDSLAMAHLIETQLAEINRLDLALAKARQERDEWKKLARFHGCDRELEDGNG